MFVFPNRPLDTIFSLFRRGKVSPPSKRHFLLALFMNEAEETMSSPAANNVAGPRQVVCVTSDQKRVLVDVDVLRLSGTFVKMCRDLDFEERGSFPGMFPVPTVRARALGKVIAWCKGHKGKRAK